MKRLAITLAIMAMLVGCTDNPVAPDETVRVRYEVTNGFCSTVQIRIVTESGQTLNFATDTSPWTHDLGDIDKGVYLHIEAWSSEIFVGAWVTVKIYRDGALYRTATGSGVAPSASVSGTS